MRVASFALGGRGDARPCAAVGAGLIVRGLGSLLVAWSLAERRRSMIGGS